MSIESDGLRGVLLGDVFRDYHGEVWEVIGLCDRPQATFRRIRDDKQVEHVIGCLNMREQFPEGPLKPTLWLDWWGG